MTATRVPPVMCPEIFFNKYFSLPEILSKIFGKFGTVWKRLTIAYHVIWDIRKLKTYCIAFGDSGLMRRSMLRKVNRLNYDFDIVSSEKKRLDLGIKLIQSETEKWDKNSFRHILPNVHLENSAPPAKPAAKNFNGAEDRYSSNSRACRTNS